MSEKLNIETELEAINASNEEQQVYIDRANAFDRLSKTDDYKLVIEEGLFQDELDRLNQLILTPNIKNMEVTENILSKILTIRYINEYFGSANNPGIINTMSANAKRTIEENERYRDSILAEDMK